MSLVITIKYIIIVWCANKMLWAIIATLTDKNKKGPVSGAFKIIC